jgi:hypothetical protein
VKRCPRCGRHLPFAQFARNRSSKDGLGSYCRPCHNIVTRENRIRKHGSGRNYLAKYRYGIEAEVADALITAQGFFCPVCKLQLPEHIDHDHVTGRVRGVLCFNCNGALGRFEDDVPRLKRAIEYLARHQGEDDGETDRRNGEEKRTEARRN